MRPASDRIVAFSAGLIGVAALGISAYQAFIMREQQRASVWPRVDIFVTYSPTTFRVNINNPGIGPALIQYAEVIVDGQPLKSWKDVLAALGVPSGYDQSKIADRALSPNQSQDIFSPSGEAAISALNAQGDRVNVRICYCSIYKECWIAHRTLKSGARLRFDEVSACELEEARRFGQ